MLMTGKQKLVRPRSLLNDLRNNKLEVRLDDGKNTVRVSNSQTRVDSEVFSLFFGESENCLPLAAYPSLTQKRNQRPSPVDSACTRYSSAALAFSRDGTLVAERQCRMFSVCGTLLSLKKKTTLLAKCPRPHK